MNTLAKDPSDKTARILLLDDETEITDVCARILRKNYAVVKTSSPFEAASFLDASRQTIDLVISDYQMPGMNGAEFVSYIRKLGINTPVVLYTGQKLDAQSRELDQFVKILAKPFGADQLRDTVASVLASIEKQSQPAQTPHGLLPRLAMVMENLEAFLQRRGLSGLRQISPDDAMSVLGPGENYSIYLSWHYLHEICKKG